MKISRKNATKFLLLAPPISRTCYNQSEPNFLLSHTILATIEGRISRLGTLCPWNWASFPTVLTGFNLLLSCHQIKKGSNLLIVVDPFMTVHSLRGCHPERPTYRSCQYKYQLLNSDLTSAKILNCYFPYIGQKQTVWQLPNFRLQLTVSNSMKNMAKMLPWHNSDQPQP